jgi:PGF-CTERM protein
VAATIEGVTLEDPTVTISTAGTVSGGVSVTEVSATFTLGTNVQSTMSVSASSSPPSGTPDPSNADSVLSYVDVTVEGPLATRMSEGRFTIDVSDRDVDPATVTAQRYNGSEWHDVETEPVGDSRVEIISPDGYSAFAVSTNESAEPDQPTPTPTPVETPTGVETPTPEKTPTATSTPTQTPTLSTTATPVETATPTQGASGPGFGPVVALVALLVVLAKLTRRSGA